MPHALASHLSNSHQHMLAAMRGCAWQGYGYWYWFSAGAPGGRIDTI